MCKIHYNHHTPCGHTIFTGYIPCTLVTSPSSPRRGLFCTKLPPRASSSFPQSPLFPSSSFHPPASPIPLAPEQFNSIFPEPSALNLELPWTGPQPPLLPEEQLTVELETLASSCKICKGEGEGDGSQDVERQKHLTREEKEEKEEAKRREWVERMERFIENGEWWSQKPVVMDEGYETIQHSTETTPNIIDNDRSRQLGNEKLQRLNGESALQTIPDKPEGDSIATSIPTPFQIAVDSRPLPELTLPANRRGSKSDGGGRRRSARINPDLDMDLDPDL